MPVLLLIALLLGCAIPAAATTVNVTDSQFGAVGDMRTCADMQMTSGSAVLYSPSQCAFTSADIGKWAQVPQAGDSNGTALSAQITGYTDAQHVTLSTTAGATVTAAVVTYSDLLIATPNTGVSSIGNTFTPDQVGLSLTITGGAGFTPGTYTISSVAYSGIATLSSAAGTAASSSGTGTLALPGTIGTGNYAALGLVATYADANTGTTVNWPAGSYYIEKYKIIAGGGANGVTDITWSGCSGTVNTGYGAMVISNGAYRQLNDASGFSNEQTVSPFHVTHCTMTIEGLAVYGSVENTTQAPGIAEGRSHGIVTDTSTMTLKDLNVYGFPVDCLELGLNSIDTNDVISNVFAHDCGRQGLTVANVEGLSATNYQCSFIGYTGGYGVHAPEDCIDIEPAIAPEASGIVFTGGYLANALGALIDVDPENDSSLTMTGMTWDCSMASVTSQATCANGGFGQPTAAVTVLSGNTFYSGLNAAFECGITDSNWISSLISNNTLILAGFDGFSCGGPQAHFTNNSITVVGTVRSTHYLYFFNCGQVNNNTFFVSKNAQFNSTFVNKVEYMGANLVRNNTYSTDSTNSAYPFTADYTSVNTACGEVSEEPTYFVVTGGTSPCPVFQSGKGGASAVGGSAGFGGGAN